MPPIGSYFLLKITLTMCRVLTYLFLFACTRSFLSIKQLHGRFFLSCAFRVDRLIRTRFPNRKKNSFKFTAFDICANKQLNSAFFFSFSAKFLVVRFLHLHSHRFERRSFCSVLSLFFSSFLVFCSSLCFTVECKEENEASEKIPT